MPEPDARDVPAEPQDPEALRELLERARSYLSERASNPEAAAAHDPDALLGALRRWRDELAPGDEE